jgi:hypothetical protein
VKGGAGGRGVISTHRHKPSCPLSHEADTMPPPSPMGGVPTSHIRSPTASGNGPMGHVSSALPVCPCHKMSLSQEMPS